jgi:phage baseplate assembly protein V
VNGEHERLLANLVMIGKVAELDEANARVRVKVDGLVTDWLPWTASRAGPGVREWTMPEVDEQVVVLSQSGDPAQGVVVGSIFQESFGAPANLKTTHRVEYADGTFTQYDRTAKAMRTEVNSAGSVVLKIGGSEITMTNAKITLASNGSTLEMDSAGIRLNGTRIDLNE